MPTGKKKKKMKKDYIFTYEGNEDTEKFICSAEDGDEAMKKFKKQIRSSAIFNIEIIRGGVYPITKGETKQ